jgi:hypothetical protein
MTILKASKDVKQLELILFWEWECELCTDYSVKEKHKDKGHMTR